MSMSFRIKVILASLANLLAVSYVHYLTGFESLFFVFYFIPVALCGWYLGRLSVCCLAVLTGMAWCAVDSLIEHHYAHESLRYANGFLCFVAFAIIGLLLQGLRQSLTQQREAREALQKILNDLERSTEEIRDLQGQLQVVCAWTKRVNVDGKWVSIGEFLTDKLHAKVSYGVSPEAMEEVLKSDRQPLASSPELATA